MKLVIFFIILIILIMVIVILYTKNVISTAVAQVALPGAILGGSLILVYIRKMEGKSK